MNNRKKGRPRRDLRGQKFGMLTVIEQEQELDSNGKAQWLCQCECGKKLIIRGTNLTTYRTTSCGCKHMSATELQVLKILERLKISFKRDAPIPGLKDDRPLRADFMYEIRGMHVMIEIDGIHHYEATRYNHSGVASNLELQKKHDEMKNVWCKQHNFIMIRIPYTVPYKDITLADILPGSRYKIK